jgi:hypothetical protein
VQARVLSLCCAAAARARAGQDKHHFGVGPPGLRWGRAGVPRAQHAHAHRQHVTPPQQHARDGPARGAGQSSVSSWCCVPPDAHCHNCAAA